MGIILPRPTAHRPLNPMCPAHLSRTCGTCHLWAGPLRGAGVCTKYHGPVDGADRTAWSCPDWSRKVAGAPVPVAPVRAAPVVTFVAGDVPETAVDLAARFTGRAAQLITLLATGPMDARAATALIYGLPPELLRRTHFSQLAQVRADMAPRMAAWGWQFVVDKSFQQSRWSVARIGGAA